MTLAGRGVGATPSRAGSAAAVPASAMEASNSIVLVELNDCSLCSMDALAADARQAALASARASVVDAVRDLEHKRRS